MNNKIGILNVPKHGNKHDLIHFVTPTSSREKRYQPEAEPCHNLFITKVHGSVSVDALQRKEAEEAACGNVHDPAFKITKNYFQEKLLCNFLVKMEITDLFGWILEMSMHNFVEIFLE